MIVCTSRDDTDASFAKYLRHMASIGDDLSNICRECGLERFTEGNSLGEDRVLMGSSLDPWEDCTVDILRILLTTHDHRTTGSTEGLVGRSRHDITVWDRILESSSRDESSNVGNICHEDGSDLICNRTEFLPVYIPRIGRESCDDHLRLVQERELSQGIHIDTLIRFSYSVWDDVVDDS